MANWYKQSQSYHQKLDRKHKTLEDKDLHSVVDTISTFEDRNLINTKINDMKEIVVALKHIAEGGYQDIPASVKAIKEILDIKMMSTYTEANNLLKDALKIARDNYVTFRLIVQKAVDILYDRVRTMQKNRKEFVEKKLVERMKGLKSNG